MIEFVQMCTHLRVSVYVATPLLLHEIYGSGLHLALLKDNQDGDSKFLTFSKGFFDSP